MATTVPATPGTLPTATLRLSKVSGWKLFIKTIGARAYPRVIGAQREKSWMFFEIFLPLLAVSAYVFVYRAIKIENNWQ
jgi:ABC-2 type transport system permease protein